MKTCELDTAFFQREYFGLRRSTEEIGGSLGLSGRAIRYRMAALSLPTDQAMLKRGRPAKSPPPRGNPPPPHLSGEQHPRWKGGRYQNAYGHVFALAPDHPHANKRGYVMEHRLIMERELGRFLEPYPREIVHHRNYDPSDNRPENLEVMTHGEHIWHHRRRNADLRA